MTTNDVFNDAAVLFGMNPINFPADMVPCGICNEFTHYTNAVIEWQPGRRGFLCAPCFWESEGYA